MLNAKYLLPNLEELRDVYEFLLGRELGRLRLHHASWPYELLLTYVRRVPYLRNPLLQVFTYSEDRYGGTLAPEGIRGLLTIPASRLMLPSVNIQQYLEQVNRHRGIWTKLAHLLTETPQISHRINALIEAGLWKAPTSVEPGLDANTAARRSLEKQTG